MKGDVGVFDPVVPGKLVCALFGFVVNDYDIIYTLLREEPRDYDVFLVLNTFS